MNYLNTLRFMAFCILYTITNQSFSQSISGNVSTSSTAVGTLGYANVSIFKNGKMVANVLTDESGNFNVKLDTGVYICEINYAGYKKVTKEIKVVSDEKSEFKMEEDTESKYSETVMLASGVVSSSSSSRRYKRSSKSRAIEYEYSSSDEVAVHSPSYSVGLIGKESFETSISKTSAWGISNSNDSSNYGKLTAGEINDFSKWNQWSDLTANELKEHASNWGFMPTSRYMVQIKDQNSLPLANVKVELLNGTKVLFSTFTDNTGKAELWESLKYDTLFKPSVNTIRANFNGNTKSISSIKGFEYGINSIIFESNCEQSQNVDIAIVVDATGSMQDEINYLKSDLNDVIFKSKSYSNTLNFRFANIFYRDKGDKYLTETQNFTPILSESISFTNMHNADGGGDYEEAVEIALDSAINKLSWSKDARCRILFLVLDAPPHNNSDIQKKLVQLSIKAAEKGIRIVPITGSGTNKSTEYLMRTLALVTNGTYTFLSDHSGIGNSHIEPSTDNYKVEILNDLLIRIIKSYTYMPDCQQIISDLGINLPDSIVIVKNKIDSLHTDTLSLDSAKANIEIEQTNKDSVDNVYTEIKWKFYPNPTNGILNIESDNEIKELYISDLSGKLILVVKEIKQNEVVQIDLSDYASGIYLIRYPTGKQWISGKISLIRNK